VVEADVVVEVVEVHVQPQPVQVPEDVKELQLFVRQVPPSIALHVQQELALQEFLLEHAEVGSFA